MRLLSDQPLAPFGRAPHEADVDPVLAPKQLDIGVGGHLAQDLRHALRALHVHGAPPEGGLRAPERRECAGLRGTSLIRVLTASSMRLFVAESGPSAVSAGSRYAKRVPEFSRETRPHLALRSLSCVHAMRPSTTLRSSR